MDRTDIPRVFLVVVDDSSERPMALYYASRRARRTGGRVALLHVIPRAESHGLAGVEALMRQEARQEAEQLIQRLARTVVDEGGPMKRRRSGRMAAILPAALALLVAGCGGSGSGSSVAQRPPTRKVRHEREAPPPRRRTKAEPHGPVARCGPGDLVVSHTELGFGALSHYGTDFDVTNVSPHACRISGFPKIFEEEADGRQVGGAARHGTSFVERGPGTVAIARNRDAVFKAGWTENVYAAGECKPRQVTHFRVVLPGSREAQTVPYPVPGRCTTRVAQESFSVGRIEPPPERGGGPKKAPFTRPALPSEGLPR